MKKVILILCSLLVVGGVGGTIYFITQKENPIDKVADMVKESKPLSCLTGLPISEEEAKIKPVSIMVENSKQALPQWGLSSADVVFETLAEGGVTRNLALFANSSNVPKIGPTRSVRKYFPPLACPVNPLFIHFGGSDTGYNAIKDCGMDSINGVKQTSAFAQDKSRASRGKEHSYYTSSELFLPIAEKNGTKMTGQQNSSMFLFGDKAISDGQADSISFKFSGFCSAKFDYDTATSKYEKSQFGSPQIDANTNKPIAVDNVLILYANITGDSDGSIRREINYKEGGSGKYLNQGKYTNIRWSKNNDKENINFMDMEGSALAIKPGKTWICIVPNEEQAKTTITPAPTTDKQ